MHTNGKVGLWKLSQREDSCEEKQAVNIISPIVKEQWRDPQKQKTFLKCDPGRHNGKTDMKRWKNTERPTRDLLDKEGQLEISAMKNEEKRLTDLIFARAVLIVK